MRLSHYFLKPRKDTPSDSTLISHKLMIKSSMIKQTTSGIYAWLPLGLKVLKKIEDIIRKFHNLYGCQELLMPTIQSSSIWKKSERYNDYGPEMLKFRDRNKKELLYGPTNEELITEIFKEYINSYKDLPKNLYQIQWKFRDEIRPRYGVMRCREFLMKDNYSFDISKNDAEKSYDNMFKCYLEIFNEIGINVIPVKADPGAMGGDLSHEFHLISKSGDTDIYYDKKIGDINGLNARNSFKLLRNLYSVTKDEYKKKQDLDASKLIKTKGIEIGHIFYFGTKYSDKLDAYVLNEKGQKINVEMGSYGIGISRLVAAIIESSHDEKGIIWPKNISPFNVGLINLNNKNKELIRISDKLYDYLKKNNIDVLYDDTNERPGEKFANIDLIGVPSQIILGENSLKENSVEIKNRKTKKIIKIKTKNMNEIIKKI
jgi:prolyl-tRNA synthetase